MSSSNLSVEDFREARASVASLKMEYMNLRQYGSDFLFVVVEGVQDKSFYYHLIKRLDDTVDIEFIVAQTKIAVLNLRGSLQNTLDYDLKNTIFCVDRDYSDTVSDKDLYVTDRYSIESYLVDPCVVEDFLKNDFNLNCFPVVRRQLLETYGSDLQDFLEACLPINKRAYEAYKAEIERIKPLPKSIVKFCDVKFKAVTALDVDVTSIVQLQSEPESIASHELPRLDSVERCRGKYLLDFCSKWLQSLKLELTSNSSVYFPCANHTRITAGVSFDRLLANTPVPNSFRVFWDDWPRLVTE